MLWVACGQFHSTLVLPESLEKAKGSIRTEAGGMTEHSDDDITIPQQDSVSAFDSSAVCFIFKLVHLS